MDIRTLAPEGLLKSNIPIGCTYLLFDTGGSTDKLDIGESAKRAALESLPGNSMVDLLYIVTPKARLIAASAQDQMSLTRDSGPFSDLKMQPKRLWERTVDHALLEFLWCAAPIFPEYERAAQLVLKWADAALDGPLYNSQWVIAREKFLKAFARQFRRFKAGNLTATDVYRMYVYAARIELQGRGGSARHELVRKTDLLAEIMFSVSKHGLYGVPRYAPADQFGALTFVRQRSPFRAELYSRNTVDLYKPETWAKDEAYGIAVFE